MQIWHFKMLKRKKQKPQATKHFYWEVTAVGPHFFFQSCECFCFIVGLFHCLEVAFHRVSYEEFSGIQAKKFTP